MYCSNIRRKYCFALMFVVVFVELLFAGDDKPNEWEFLNTTAIHASQFIDKHPNYDGRGVIVFILDSGIDLGVAGLQKTSTGDVKIIDVRDFSEQGDVELYLGKKGKVDREKFIEHPDGFRLFNYHLLEQKPIGGEYFIGYLDEQRFKNSQIKDINNNGKYDDVFGVLAFEVESADSSHWIAFVDTDGDQHLEDEKPVRDYSVNFDTFQLRGGDPRYDCKLMTFALNISPYEMKISFHFDDDGHGTHVAGIAAGYEINGQPGYHGIAPGAQIISLKIGSGILKGGCTISGSLRRAINFVEEYASTHKIPVVVNLSYGIGSVQEGNSDADRLIDDLLSYNDNIFVSISNGNEGPGISSTGTPAASAWAFSVGGYIPASTANKVLGTKLKGDKIFYFSSRGGELNKPDAIAPGVASSSVPPFLAGDEMKGTSMAAPQVAGAAALLISAFTQSIPDQTFHAAMIKWALKYSAVPLKGYSYVDQGNGVINVPIAFKLLKSRLKRNKIDPIIHYEINTNCPTAYNGESCSAYWRCDGYFPSEDEEQNFYVTPIFKDSLNADQRANFYRAFYLKSTHSWLSPDKKAVYVKGENAIEIPVRYHAAKLKQPGLYCGKIVAYRKDSGNFADPSHVEFELLSSVIVPYTFTHENHYQRYFDNKQIEPGDVDRYFVLVPPGATSAKITISPAKDKYCNVIGYCFTPAGMKYFRTQRVKNVEQKDVIKTISKEDLSPGIWEIDIYADYLNIRKSTYNLKISFLSFQIEPSVLNHYNYQLGKEPNGQFRVINQFNTPFYGFGNGEIQGYQRAWEKVVRGQDTFSYNFTVKSDVEKVEFIIDFNDESFLKFSDVAINVYNSRGRHVVKDAMTFDRGKISFRPKADEYYTLEINASHVYSIFDSEWKFSLTEKYYFQEKIKIKIYAENDRLFKLFPSSARVLEFTMDKSPRITPEGFQNFGVIKFFDRNLLQQTFEIPLLFENH